MSHSTSTDVAARTPMWRMSGGARASWVSQSRSTTRSLRMPLETTLRGESSRASSICRISITVPTTDSGSSTAMSNISGTNVRAQKRPLRGGGAAMARWTSRRVSGSSLGTMSGRVSPGKRH